MIRTIKSSSTLSLRLSSQKLLDNVEPSRRDFINLLLVPEQYSDISIQLKNLWNQTLYWKLEVDGDFPIEWCQWDREDIREIASQQQIEETLRFQIPTSFFEEQLAISKKNPQLKLDYQSRIRLYVRDGEEWELAGYEIFYLAVRPLTSYMEFLPAFYKEVDFLGRFMAIIEQTFDPAVQTLDVLWAYLDPLTAPEAMLPFLAQWVGWEISDRFTIEQQRRLIRYATTLYRWHGTRYGLRFYLHLCTGLPLDEHLPEEEKHISIQENYSRGFVLGETYLGSDSVLGGGIKYHFEVRLKVDRPDVEIDRRMIEDIIRREKSAFSSYELFIDYVEEE